MKCYLLRHGQAVDADAWQGSDFDRPLTAKGKTRVERAAKALAAWGLDLDVIVTSPLLRAQQTAAIVAEGLRFGGRIVEDARLGGGFGPVVLADVLAVHGAANAVMLVGHEPALSRIVGQLVGGGNVEFKPASLACVELAQPWSDRGTLNWLIPAEVFALKS